MFTAAYSQDLSKAGRYDLHGSVINVWPGPDAKLHERQKPRPMGAFHFQMRNSSGIWKIQINGRFHLVDVLFVLRELELKALGRVKHGKLDTERLSPTKAQPAPDSESHSATRPGSRAVQRS